MGPEVISFKDMIKLPENSENVPGLYAKLECNKTAWLRGATSASSTLNEKDLHRKLALKDKNNDIFKAEEGIIPRYAGYVPGAKFKYGNTFYRETINVKGNRK